METYSLITGASSGIGKASAYSLAKLNKNLILISRRMERLEELKEVLESKYNIKILIHSVDVTDQKQVNDFFEKISDYSIDVFVNNAGLALGKSSFQESDFDDYERMIETNIKGFTYMARKTIPFLIKTKGHIINVSSVSGIESYPGGSVYCGTKAYVKMLSKGFRIDLVGKDVRVTDIAPGAVNTEFSTVRFHGNKEQADDVYKGFSPLLAEDIADCIEFAVTRPPHVNIEYLLVMPTDQAAVAYLNKK